MYTRRSSLSAVSLFSGAGGMDIGFQRAGIEVVLANDINAAACATYRRNHSGEVFQGSLLDMDAKARLDGRAIDLVFGGPPCQGFSVAGKMDPDDERSQLIHSFFDVVDDLQPRAFVCENVKALAVLEKWRNPREQLMARGRRSYRVALVVLNASHYGVPQNRERMFLIGIHKDIFQGSDADLQEAIGHELVAQEKTPPTIGQVVRSLGLAGTPRNSRTCAAKITYCKAPVLRKSPYAGMLFNGAGRPLPSNGFATTLPASMGGNKTPIVDEAEIFEGEPSFIETYHRHLMEGGEPYMGNAPSRLRRLTIDECIAIQTFPKDYVLTGSKSAQYRQLGNAVPPGLAEAVARATLHALGSDLTLSMAAE
jgi:DNA (cytosine-5)-methyltransferase 1